MILRSSYGTVAVVGEGVTVDEAPRVVCSGYISPRWQITVSVSPKKDEGENNPVPYPKENPRLHGSRIAV